RLIELAEAEGVRDRYLFIVGGPRISHAFAKELGYDAGFGPGSNATMVASYILKNWWHGWVNLSLFPPFMHLCNVSAYRNVVSGIDRICLIDTYPAYIQLAQRQQPGGYDREESTNVWMGSLLYWSFLER